MNLTNIETPADLQKANELTPVQKALEAVGELSYNEAREVMDVILQASVEFHKEIITNAVQESNVKAFHFLTKDLARLETVRSILEDVK